ncbi:response regulator [Paenibacillus sedimenti]|uniref:Response regulator n=1 Tax=Paenibacillus sedimenti TaxID=2770274 RepID=A0A926QKH0_9BACL|nr:response regulator [Paenibacillus sedimenti]MBD0381477.1 response regulator [Paenibacillus sedimenti]
MITAILADDEPIIIKGLKKLIPWEQQGIRIVGEAWTGRGLMELIERERPSLVITDISMPDGTGIDVIKEIERRGLRTKVIFISAYQEFSYAKEALALGAVDYLVKPIEKDLLLDAVQRAVSELMEESEEQHSKSKLAVYEHKDRKTQLEELFDRLLDGDIRQADAEEKLRSLHSGCIHNCYTVLLMEPEQPADDSRWGEHEKRLLLFAVGNMAEELMRRSSAGMILRKGDRLCAVVNHKDETRMEGLADDIIRNAEIYLKIVLTVGIGEQVYGAEGIKGSYRTAAEALGQAFFSGVGKSIIWSGDYKAAPVTERELGDSRQSALQALLAKDRSRLTVELDRLLGLIAGYSAGSREKAVMACYATLIEWSEGLEEVGIMQGEAGTKDQGHLTAMQAVGRYEELLEYVREMADELFRRLSTGGSGKDTQQLLTVKEFIETHYMENITLEGVASKIYMNPYYFSSFFKKHTQMNFKQYLTKVRMKQAVKLLLQTDMMVYEIAEKVGYNNARQFSDMFKKYYGKLPQEYRTQNGPKM